MAVPNRLLIMRHADAQPGTLGAKDRDRKLTPRGLRQAAARREVILAAAPKVVLCSSATRAMQTLAGLGPIEAEILVEAPLYAASATSLLLRLAQLDEAADTAMIVGHLPAVGELADALLAPGQPALSFSPSAVAHLELPDGWPLLRPSSARLVSWHP